MSTSISYLLNVNGIEYPVAGGVELSLLDAIRDQVGLTGTKEGCDDCECGACMVLVDGEPLNSCSYLAAQAQGRSVTTVEGLAGDERLHPLQQSMLDCGAVQCGFCTPGMIMSAHALLNRNPSPSEEEIRIGISGNLCRCTGYTNIVEAVRALTRQQ